MWGRSPDSGAASNCEEGGSDGSESRVFRDLAYVFLAAITRGLAAWKLRQPIILGYVLAGVLIGPFTPGPTVKHVHTLELFAEIGIILLMFSVGLEFSIKDLLRVRWVALIGGPVGILLSLSRIAGSGSTLFAGTIMARTDGSSLWHKTRAV